MARPGVCGVTGIEGSSSRVKEPRDMRRFARVEEDSGGVSRLRISMLLFIFSRLAWPFSWPVARVRLGLERRLLRVWPLGFIGSVAIRSTVVMSVGLIGQDSMIRERKEKDCI